MDGHPGAKEDTINQMAVESFLRGCKDKEAARCAMDKNPKTVYKALKYVKAAINNQKALFGSKPNYVARQVTFADDVKGDQNFQADIRSITKGNEVQELKNIVLDLAKKVDRLGRSNRTRSLTPPGSPQRRNSVRCYSCNEEGHYANKCTKQKDDQKSPKQTDKALNLKGLGVKANN